MIKLLGEKASKNEIDAVVNEADNNGDGTVDFEGEIPRTYTKQKIFLNYLPLSMSSKVYHPVTIGD